MISTTTLHVNLENPEDNFWELNPQLKLIEPFKSFYKGDRDRTKIASSKVMFAIAMVYDPKSKYRNLAINDRLEIIEEDYLLGKIKLHQPLVDMYQRMTQSPSQRNLNEIYNLLEKRTLFLKEVEYSLDTSKEVDNLFANTEKIYKALAIAKAEVAKEEGSTSSTKGGQELSLADQGEI